MFEYKLKKVLFGNSDGQEKFVSKLSSKTVIDTRDIRLSNLTSCQVDEVYRNWISVKRSQTVKISIQRTGSFASALELQTTILQSKASTKPVMKNNRVQVSIEIVEKDSFKMLVKCTAHGQHKHFTCGTGPVMLFNVIQVKKKNCMQQCFFWGLSECTTSHWDTKLQRSYSTVRSISFASTLEN